MKKSLWKNGEPYIWLTGAALAFSLLMVGGMVALILANGLGVFWPAKLVQFTLRDGRVILGQVMEREVTGQQSDPASYRIKVKRGNRDIDAADFLWLDEAEIAGREEPPDALVLERTEWGKFFGYIKAVRDGETTLAEGASFGLEAVKARLPATLELQKQMRGIEKKDIADINYAQERLRLRSARLQRQGVTSGPEIDRNAEEKAELERRYEAQTAGLDALKKELQTTVVLSEADGAEKEIPLANIVRLYQPNRMG